MLFVNNSSSSGNQYMYASDSADLTYKIGFGSHFTICLSDEDESAFSLVSRISSSEEDTSIIPCIQNADQTSSDRYVLASQVCVNSIHS